MPLKVDHVTIAGSRLEALASTFAAADLATDYGGHHSNGITHMSLLGFPDGTYIELVSMVRPGEKAPWWHDHIVLDGGPCGWAVQVQDVESEAARLRAGGLTVDGPTSLARKRPDGEEIEWDLAYIGEGVGAMHPFIIKDRTPRELRASPSDSVADTELVGIDTVVIAVPDLDAACAEFERVYDLGAMTEIDSERLGGRVVDYAGSPVALAGPVDPEGRLATRLATFGPTPCAILLGSRDLKLSRERFGLSPAAPWGEREVTWFETESLGLDGVGLVNA